jgi:hypothetical protein
MLPEAWQYTSQSYINKIRPGSRLVLMLILTSVDWHGESPPGHRISLSVTIVTTLLLLLQ